MFFLLVTTPSTFFTQSENIVILDDLKNPFYWHPNSEQHINFNLPRGRYYCNVPVRKNKIFEPYGDEKYPKFPKGYLSKIKVFCRKNPNKASISLQRLIIIADPKFYYHRYKPVQTFTILHEIYHTFFHSKNEKQRSNYFIHEHIEMQCDNAAKAFMLANGWNPSQVSFAIQRLLRGRHRKEVIRKKTTDGKNQFRR